MNISFDLDSTLITGGNEFETESRSLIAKLFGIEKLRKGTPILISELQKNGHTVNIYTTSFRKKSQVRFTLRYYGIKVEQIINQVENQKTLSKLNIYSSKYPTAFGFDIHIDDLRGVGMESEKYNFDAIIIEPSDKNWSAKIKNEIDKRTTIKA